MKKKTMFATAAVLFGAMVVCTSCNDDKKEIPVNDGRVQFTSSIAQASEDGNPLSRASGDTWADGDAIGIYMVNNGSTPPVVSMGAANKKYTTNATGVLTAVADNEIYYPQTGAVDFIAYYPWKETGATGINNDLYTVNVANQANQAAIDLLWAKATGVIAGDGYDKTNTQPIKLEFSHKLTKLILKTTKGDGITSLAGMTVKIKGMNTVNTFNVMSGIPGTASATADITAKLVDDGVKYEAIILPRTVAASDNITVEFTVGTDTFVWKVPATVFNNGEEHTWNITVKRTGISVTASINPWTTGTGGDGTAE